MDGLLTLVAKLKLSAYYSFNLIHGDYAIFALANRV